jgi:hypothetical protein
MSPRDYYEVFKTLPYFMLLDEFLRPIKTPESFLISYSPESLG